MKIFQFWPVYIVLLLVFTPTGTQTNVFNVLTDTTKISDKDIFNNSRTNSQQNVQVSQENRNRGEEKPLHILSDPRKELKENNPASTNTQPPTNLVIDTNLRALPIRNQLIMKTGNVIPGLAHYIRLKGNMDRDNTKSKSQAVSSPNEQTSKKSVANKDKVKSKSAKKCSHKHKPKNLQFIEDKKDSNDTPLLKEFKPVKPKKHTKLKHNHHSSTTLKPENEFYDEVKHETRENNSDRDCNKTTNTKNTTQSIFTSKVPLPTQYEIKPKEANESLDGNLQEFVTQEKPTALPNNELELMPTLVSENTTVAIFAIDANTQNAESDSKYTEPTDKAAAITSVDPESDLPEVITIKDHNYQEIEERRLPSDPEQITVDEYTSAPWATETLSSSINPYDSYAQHYQKAYSNNLKYMAENNSPINNPDNFYLRPNDLDPINTYIPEVPQVFSPPAQEVVQEIYGPNPVYQSNTINVRPENSVGRIWRTWRDTEIKLNRPKYGNNNPFQLQMNPNVVNYKKTSPLIQRFQAMSPNSYCSNLNHMWPNLYSYPFNGYVG